jgi:hypothetical protein
MSNVERIIRATFIYGHSSELDILTAQGWEVVERFEADEVFSLSDRVLPPAQNGYQPPSTMSCTRQQIGKQSYFRIRKNGETVLSELNDRLTQLGVARTADLKRIEELDKEAAKLKADIERLSADLKSSYSSNESILKQKNQIEQIKRQLEGDIGKIREHIGKKMMDEVLATEMKK